MTRHDPAGEGGADGVGTPRNPTSTSLAATATDVELADLTVPEATAITMRIRDHLVDLSVAIPMAYSRRAWAVLGHQSWDDYCDAEFGEFRVRLPREERQEVVASLRESGLSLRAIASATGNSTNTVSKDLQVSHFETPEVEPEGDLDPWAPGDTITNDGQFEETLASMSKLAPTPTTGVDGKTYKRRVVAAPTPKRRPPLVEGYTKALWDIEKIVRRLQRLHEDDRFASKRDQLREGQAGMVEMLRNDLDDLLAELRGEVRT